MKKLISLITLVMATATIACSKSSSKPGNPGTPQTNVPAALKGDWMHGDFSMTEYWSQDPDEYLGNGLEFAFAFTFNADGTYTQYFTSSSVMNGVTIYQQSVTKGTVEVNETSKTIITHPTKAHYKRTSNGQVVEERDLENNEMNDATTYSYATGVEPNGTGTLYLKLAGTNEPLAFLKKP